MLPPAPARRAGGFNQGHWNGYGRQMASDIAQYLSQFRGQEVIYLPNPGNAGDSVIAAGTYHRMDSVGLAYVTPPRSRLDATGRIVFYGGGGNLVGPETFAARTIRAVHRQAKHLTILPHTVKDVDDLLAEFGGNVTVICRERVSYEHVASRGGRYQTLLMDDMAFSLDIERLMSGRDPFSAPAMLWHFLLKQVLRDRPHAGLATVKRYLRPGPEAARLAARPRGGTLHCFRRDGEAGGMPIPPDNVDLSQVFEYGVAPPTLAFHAARSMIRTLQNCDEVHTDRLHVGVSGALAGTRTLFYPNNYYKCRAVYEFSMQHRFPNVVWMG
jgi:exopolysaccharide biosynthesis predicted pyruvyltransferase EpsI